MPRKIGWTNSAQKNTTQLLEALLSLADEELELDDLELKTALQVKWVSENQLRVTGESRQKRAKGTQTVEIGTKKEHLVKLVETAGKKLELSKPKEGSGSSQAEREAEAIQVVLDCLRDLEVLNEDPKNRKKNQGYWIFTLVLKHQTASREENLREIQLKWNEKIGQKSSETSQTTPLFSTGRKLDWRDICHTMLDEQLRRYQFRRQATGAGLGHEVSIYVLLGLVKPTIQPRRGEEFCPTPAEGRLQYQPSEKEIEKRFEADEFLRQVIEAGEGKNIAIIGEPGAGKSTWLEQIARHLVGAKHWDDRTQTEDDPLSPRCFARLPICIQLGSLDGKTLEEYLLQVWLKEALSLQGMVVTAEMQTGLIQLFNSRQVWLLLDGVDEIAVDVMLSEAKHLGDSSLHSVPFRMTSNPLQGIANQLRGWVAQGRTVLTCRLNVWQANDRALPNFETYRTLDFDESQVGEFIREWFARAGKPELGKQLREKLGESGRERIQDLIRHPLRLALLCQTWMVKQGDLPKTKATLYQRFRDDFYEWKKTEFPISWQQRQELNAALGRLAVAAIENQTQLRESLAYEVMGESLFELAQRIGWLNLVYRDAETDEPVYAFFHLTFQEYFAALAINDWHFFLTHDNDNPQPLPGNVYRIFELQWKEVILLWLGRDKREVSNEQKEQFIQALVEFEDGCYDFYGYRAYFLASAGIAEFEDCSKADEIVAQIITWSFGYFNIAKQQWWQYLEPIAEGARAVFPETDRQRSIVELTKLLTSQNEQTKCKAAFSLLLKYDLNNSNAFNTLISLLDTSSDSFTLKLAAIGLLDYLEYDLNNSYVNKALTSLSTVYDRLVDDDPDQVIWLSRRSYDGFFKRFCGIDLRSEDKYIKKKYIKKKLLHGTIYSPYSEFNNDSAQDKTVNFSVNSDEINNLIYLLQKSEDIDVCCQAVYRLRKIYEENHALNYEEVCSLTALIERLSLAKHSLVSYWKIVDAVINRISDLGEIIIKCVNKDSSVQIDALDFLIEVLINALIEVVNGCIYSQPDFYTVAVYNLGILGVGNLDAVNVLINVVNSCQESITRIQALTCLRKMPQGNLFELVVKGLKRYLQHPDNKTDSILTQHCYEVIWHCAQNIYYPAFYRAWHHSEVAENLAENFIPATQNFNSADIPKLLDAAINNNVETRNLASVQLICIDGSKFIDHENPTLDIYDQLISQGFPERQNGEPETLQQLKLYWNQLRRKSDRQLVLIFYKSTAEKQGFSETFINALSKFDGTICVVSDQLNEQLKIFSPCQLGLVEHIIEWITDKIIEG